jgi:hypothetical protein
VTNEGRTRTPVDRGTTLADQPAGCQQRELATHGWTAQPDCGRKIPGMSDPTRKRCEDLAASPVRQELDAFCNPPGREMFLRATGADCSG